MNIDRTIAVVSSAVLLGIGVESFRADAQPQTNIQQQGVSAGGKEPRRVQGERTMNQLTGGKGLPPHYKQLEKDFPELADMTLKYALGDVWGRKVLSPQTRQLVSLAGFAAQGAMPEFKVHAGYALNLGVKPEELMEVVYITTVTSGYPRALTASSTLKELFTEKKIKLPLGKGEKKMAAQETNGKEAAAPAYVGMWVTGDGQIRQELLPNGRYDEARGDRKSAYQGRYEITGNHIRYWDDTGFTADGDFIGGVLHHGGMIMFREVA